MDYQSFWKRNEESQKDNCFNEEASHVALGIQMNLECVYSELGAEGDPWGPVKPQEDYELSCRYNDIAEKVVGKRLLLENLPEEHVEFPYVRRIGEVFGGVYEWPKNSGEWLHSSMTSMADLEKSLDHVDALDIEDFMLPENWEKETRRIYERTGKRPALLRHIRGPVTLGTSLFGVEELIFLYYDNPDLFKRFSKTILRIILKMSQIMDREAGYTADNRPSGFFFADDDCNLMTPEMYEHFGYPVLKGVFDHYSPEINDKRYQHSDSAMAHLLPQLGELNLTGCNFGPTVLVDEIRKYMPRTRIDGCLAPFTFMNNDFPQIRKEVRRDCEMIKATGTRGLNIYTAGSINNGSSLESLKHVMETIEEFGHY